MNNTRKSPSKLKHALVEWHEFSLPDLIPRTVDYSLVDRYRLVSIIGPRRAGKTWVCFEWIKELLGRGIPRENIIYMNFEDERLVPLDGGELTALLDVQAELYERAPEKPLYCFLDEVHNVPNWSKWVRRTVDQNRDVSILLTGSSSKMLSSEIATELRGRGISVTVFPYSFKEYLRARGYSISVSGSLLYSKERNVIKRHFNDYFTRGGFPEITGYHEYRDTLQQYYRAMFTRDMVERFTIKNIRQFEDFLKIQITRFSALSSVSNAEKEMKEIGYSVSKNTLMNYLGYAKDVFLLFDLCKFDNKVTRQLRAPRKVYVVDHGLLNAIRFSVSEDRGRILENIAFMEMRRRYDTLFYHIDKFECDFIAREGNSVTQCFQACWSIQKKETAEREIRGLLAALHTYNLDRGTILTENEHADLERDGKKIAVRPLWYFALEEQA
ncbi:MAG: ATP-binding protein [Chitinispirillaceae bacterium]|nr:ATP-binding protein [Chitinispirillaceae bacterium]